MEVDPEAIRVIAGTVDAAAGLRRGFASRSAGLAPVDERDPGWSAAGVARSAMAGWDGLVRRLSSASAFFGRELVLAAADVEAEDQDAARVIAAITEPGARVVGP